MGSLEELACRRATERACSPSPSLSPTSPVRFSLRPDSPTGGLGRFRSAWPIPVYYNFRRLFAFMMS